MATMSTFAAKLFEMASTGSVMPAYAADGAQTNIDELEQKYAPLKDDLTAAVLTEAQDATPEFVSTLQASFPDMTITARPASKSIERVLAKLAMQTRKDRFFKAFNDFASVRVVVQNVDELATFANVTFPAHLASMAAASNGQFVRRPTFKNEPDLVYFNYVYLPQYKHVVEIQVLHPFAERVFNADSAEHSGPPGTNYWANGFYEAVKNNLLKGGLTMEQMHDVTRSM